VLFERDRALGGTPATVIRSARFPAGHPEVDTMLKPAIESGSLEVRFGQRLGEDIVLDELRREYDVVLLAAGLWGERTLGRGQGVFDSLTFLRDAKRGVLDSVPARVAVLGGSDCAMDAASVVCELGAEDLYIVYSGSFADMHWHMPEGWFRDSGAHALMMTEPLGYERDASGTLSGVRVRSAASGAAESVLPVEMVIEAMGLGIDDGLRNALAGIAFTEDGFMHTAGPETFETALGGVFVAGGLINGGASVAQCVAEGMRAAEEIDTFLKSRTVED